MGTHGGSRDERGAGAPDELSKDLVELEEGSGVWRGDETELDLHCTRRGCVSTCRYQGYSEHLGYRSGPIIVRMAQTRTIFAASSKAYAFSESGVGNQSSSGSATSPR